MILEEKIRRDDPIRHEMIAVISPDKSKRKTICSHTFIFDQDRETLLKEIPDIMQWTVEGTENDQI